MSKKRSAQSAKKAVSKRVGAKAHAGKPAPAISQRAVPPVVGVGASAGGLEAFTQLLGALPTDTGMAFVLVQHLEPTHKSVLTPLLARATSMPVQEVSEGMHVEPNHVYVIPANADLSLLDGLLHIVGRKAPAGRHLPIDYFFSSLAGSRGVQATGVILSGTGSDGSAGIKAIKSAGGMTFAQEPRSAKFDGMPRSAIASGCVDLILSPERIARELARIVRGPSLELPPPHAVPELPAQDEDWIRLFRILRLATGVDFGLYKKSTVKRRLARRMAVRKADTLRAYLKILEGNRAEADALFEELLILVTEFYRDPDVFVVFEKKILPKILAEKPASGSIRIWVAGCSTGEEAYSFAISVLEYLGDNASGTQIQIFGTDASEKAIEKARLGTYSAAEVKRVPQEQMRRYFTPVNGGFQIKEAVRDLCVFARHDLTRDPPFSKLDMISCRNVLIYMEPVLQKRILAAFHYGLRPNGVLLLGKSENLGSRTDVFAAKDRKNKFFKKIEGAHVPLALVQSAYEQVSPARGAKEPMVALDLEREATQFVWERYSHAGLVVNNDLQIIHFLGDTSPYVQHAPGRASLQLMRGLREEFVLEVGAALQRARRGEPVVRREGIEFRRNGSLDKVSVEVRPLIRSGPERSFLILFESTGGKAEGLAKTGAESAKERNEAEKPDRAGRSREVHRLRHELAGTREYVQAIIRDQEATNEELKTSNEEALSSNEELQSTNEELETAKEELQSSNEELVTLNEQLQNRNSELAQLSGDLGNVLSGVDIPIVILDVDRHIRRFTPPAEKLLGLITGDIGRPIGKLRLGVNIPNLDELIARAIEKGEQTALEVSAESGRWYSLRIRPFLAGEDEVQGVLMAFVDINELKRLERKAMERAEESESTAQVLLESAAQAILACNQNGQIRLANATAEKMFGYTRENLIGQTLESMIPERFRAAHVRQRAAWFAEPRSYPMGVGLDLAGLRSDGSEFPIEVSLSLIRSDSGALAVAFISDITEQRKSEQRLTEYSAQLQAEVDALQRMRRTNDGLWRTHDLKAGLEQILNDGIALLEADMGNIRVLNSESGTLEILAQRGFSPDFLEYFRTVSPEENSAWGRSFRSGKRVVIEDVNVDPDYAPYRAAAERAGYRSVQSTPLLGSDGKLIGVFSTHFREPHRLFEPELLWLDLNANRAAQFIERVRTEERLQRATRAMMAAREENNREVARELHDVFSQELVAIGMELLSLKKNGNSAVGQSARIAELAQSVVDLAKRLHQTSRNLHPAIVEDLGLGPALQQECDSFESARGIPTHFTANNLPRSIDPNHALCLYRVVQECLRNIHKHARETDSVWVSLTGGRGGIELSVKDRGDGFELDQALRGGGLGLISMEERVRAQNGTLAIQSKRGKGTTVTAFIPIEIKRPGKAPNSKGRTV